MERVVNLIDRQREHFNSIAERYKTARKGTNHVLLKQLMWTHALGNIDRFRGRHIDVVEPMCGFGDAKALVETYLSPDVAYSGYDYSDKVIDLLRQEKPDINCWQADATTYELPAAKYDVVAILGGLHHVPDHATNVVAQAAKALKPGGIFISLEPTFGNSLFRKVRETIYERNTLFDAMTERTFDVRELFGMFESTGLKPVKILHPGLLSYVLYYNPDAFPFLNLGGPAFVRAAFGIDKPFFESAIGRRLSFATLSIWERPPA